MEENTNKKFITDVLANQMMDNFACAYLSVFDCVNVDPETNEYTCSQEDATKAMDYAREQFILFTDGLAKYCGCDIDVVSTAQSEETANAEVVENNT